MPSGFDAPKSIVALMDTTYWGRKFGVVTIKDHLSGHVLWRKFIDRKERIEDYVEGVRWLEEKRHVTVVGVVSDGLRGLKERLSPRLFQLCQFHQIKSVKRKLTSKPKLEASREFLDLVRFMTKTDKASFTGLLGEWEAKWKDFLGERSIGPDGKSHYAHKRLRSAYLSVKRNMPSLWTFEDHYGSGIPNTNNGIESLFTEVKRILRLHKGLSMSRRKLLISGLLNAHSPYRTGAGDEIGSKNDT